MELTIKYKKKMEISIEEILEIYENCVNDFDFVNHRKEALSKEELLQWAIDIYIDGMEFFDYQIFTSNKKYEKQVFNYILNNNLI